MSSNYTFCLATAVLEEIEQWLHSHRSPILELVERIPLDGPRAARLALLVQLRLGAWLAESTDRWDHPEENALILFVRRSMKWRHALARRKAKELVTALGDKLRGEKYALCLLHEIPAVKWRYFRDIDFIATRAEFSAIRSRVSALGYVIGDIAPEDWSSFIVPFEETINEQILTTPEVHFFGLDFVDDDLIEPLWSEVAQRWPRLVECQFYGVINGTFLTRTFLDIEFDTNAATTVLDSNEAYWHSFFFAMEKDVRKKRLGLNQYFEFLEYIEQTNKAPDVTPIPVANSLSRIFNCTPPEIHQMARVAAINFVAEKLNWFFSSNASN